MAQGLCAGATSYEFQSDKDILEDIIKWIDYSNEVLEYYIPKFNEVIKSDYWSNIHSDFCFILQDYYQFNKTVINDFNIVKQAIERQSITTKEVSLLSSIGSKSKKLNNDFGVAYYKDPKWHDYSNDIFRTVEKMYAEGRDLCATLMDAGNAAERLKDYMNDVNITNYSINGNVYDSQVQMGVNNSTQKIVKQDIPYELILNTLIDINKMTDNSQFDVELGVKSCEFKAVLKEAINEVEQNGNSSKIKQLLGLLNDFAIGVSSGVIANVLCQKFSFLMNLF